MAVGVTYQTRVIHDVVSVAAAGDVSRTVPAAAQCRHSLSLDSMFEVISSSRGLRCKRLLCQQLRWLLVKPSSNPVQLLLHEALSEMLSIIFSFNVFTYLNLSTPWNYICLRRGLFLNVVFQLKNHILSNRTRFKPLQLRAACVLLDFIQLIS